MQQCGAPRCARGATWYALGHPSTHPHFQGNTEVTEHRASLSQGTECSFACVRDTGTDSHNLTEGSRENLNFSYASSVQY